MWTAILDSSEAAVVQVVEAGTEIVGFGSAGKARDARLGTQGEVSSIYLLDRVKRRGIGRALLTSLLPALPRSGHAPPAPRLRAGNEPSGRFYEAVGGHSRGTRVVEGSHGEMHEVAYVWDDLARFAGAN